MSTLCQSVGAKCGWAGSGLWVGGVRLVGGWSLACVRLVGGWNQACVRLVGGWSQACGWAESCFVGGLMGEWSRDCGWSQDCGWAESCFVGGLMGEWSRDCGWSQDCGWVESCFVGGCGQVSVVTGGCGCVWAMCSGRSRDGSSPCVVREVVVEK
jgi:hypothetical protein